MQVMVPALGARQAQGEKSVKARMLLIIGSFRSNAAGPICPSVGRKCKA